MLRESTRAITTRTIWTPPIQRTAVCQRWSSLAYQPKSPTTAEEVRKPTAAAPTVTVWLARVGTDERAEPTFSNSDSRNARSSAISFARS